MHKLGGANGLLLGAGLFGHQRVPMLPATYVVILALPTLLSLVGFHNRGNKVYFHITHITFGGMWETH